MKSRQKHAPFIKPLFTYLFFPLFLSYGHAQTVSIQGLAHVSYSGKVIQVFSEQDQITHLEHKEATDTIAPDGYFELPFVSNRIQRVKLKIEQATFYLYVQPDFVYGITVPELDPALKYANGAELPLDIGILGHDTTELNVLLMDFEKLYNGFFTSDDERFLSRPMMFKRADSLQKVCDFRYRSIQNEYFKAHIKYNIASINASVSRGENYLINGYILHKPILYTNKAYMDFFSSCFTGYLKAASTGKSTESIQNLINKETNYQRLSIYFKDDKFLKNDTLRELVILHNLWHYSFEEVYDPDAIKKLLSQISSESKVEEHRRISNHMLNYMNKLLVGSEAPLFSARAANGKIGNLQQFKGRWVYLNFFSTGNAQSLREMPKIASLKKKFGGKMVFLSICLDDSVKTYMNYIRSNPRYDWPIWFSNERGLSKTAKEAYFVSGTEAYFLISNFGVLALSPAPSPSEGIEYRFNLLFKPKRKNTKTGIR